MIETDETIMRKRATQVHRAIKRLGGVTGYERLRQQVYSTQPVALSAALSLLEEEGRIAVVLHKMTPYYVLADRLEEWG